MSIRRYICSALLGLTILSGRSALAAEPAHLVPVPATSAQNQALADVIVTVGGVASQAGVQLGVN